MDRKTIDLILAMFRKEEQLWRIEVNCGALEGAKKTLARVEKAEADFRKAVGA